MSSRDSVDGAIKAWSVVLGDANVRTSPEILDRYARTTQDTAPRPSCILFPESTAQVQEIVRIAGEHGVVVYPISRGRNWGYGDACAPTPGAAIVDFSRMNRILEVNTELAYALIEPGVTQGQLYAYLAENNTGLWMDSTGAGPESSFVGNTLDRGFGHTRYGDHFQTCCGMEVVLADGRVLKTGFGHFPNAKAVHVYRYGVGPFLDGIFCQSNFGIVTKIGLWLMPEPEDFCFFFCTLKKGQDFERLVDALRPFRIRGMLNSAIH
ncbi:MAG: FAD-dependent oxidoreductase, partial [Candidatus Hydrogenedentes bacterium]|nr:FAD-dependent oxidoreductase [Candidatus Hydrogenedentota bacterium]